MPQTAAPPDYSANTILIMLLAFGAYYLGIFIRKRALPGTDSPPLAQQFLLGIPVALIVLPPMLPIIQSTMTNWSVMVTIGLIVEQGMIVNETATARIQNAIESRRRGEDSEGLAGQSEDKRGAA